MMATATIYRPSIESMIQAQIPFTALPNSLIHHAQLGLKPRDASVLNYLLSKPKEWNICPSAIANALYISVSTVRRALTFLVKLGIAGYSRFADGKTKWFVKLPDFDLSLKPQSQKPQGVKPQVQDGSVLKQNDLSEMTKETTNIGSVVVSLPDYINKTETVKNELGALDAKLQVSVLKMLADAMLCAGKVKNPTAYLLGMVRNAAKGSFSSSKQANQAPAPSKPFFKPNNDLDLINLRNELANYQRLYKLSPNEPLFSQIQAIEEKLNKVVS